MGLDSNRFRASDERLLEEIFNDLNESLEEVGSQLSELRNSKEGGNGSSKRTNLIAAAFLATLIVGWMTWLTSMLVSYDGRLDTLDRGMAVVQDTRFTGADGQEMRREIEEWVREQLRLHEAEPNRKEGGVP